MTKLKFTDLELALIADSLGIRGNALNVEFKQMQNYFRANDKASLEYVLETLELTKELIELCELSIKVLKQLPTTEKISQSLKDYEENLEIYNAVINFLSNPITARVE